MDDRDYDIFQGMAGMHSGLTGAVWATGCLWSLQMMHEANRAWLNLAMGYWAGTLKATRLFCETPSNGNSSPGNSESAF